MKRESENNTTVFRKTRIMLADDHPLIRQATRTWIEKQQDMEIIAETSNGKETIDIAAKLLPDVIIMDIRIPIINGIRATKLITASHPEIKILGLSVHKDREHINSIISAGACGYITKETSGEDIIHAIRSIINGEKILPSENIQPKIDESSNNLEKDEDLVFIEKLNNREDIILKLAAIGMTNKQISEQLGISLRMIKAHMATIFLKLGVKSRTEAIAMGLKTGILTINDIKGS